MNHRLHMLCHSRAHPLCQTHTDTSRLSSSGSEGSPEVRNAKDDCMSFPPRPRRWSDTIVDVGDSRRRRRGCYVTWLENWTKTKARDLKNTHVRTHTHGSRNRLHFPCYSVSILSPGSALPTGRVNRCVCARFRERKGITVSDGRSFPSEWRIRLQNRTRASSLYIFPEFTARTLAVNQVESRALIRFHYFRFGSQSLISPERLRPRGSAAAWESALGRGISVEHSDST